MARPQVLPWILQGSGLGEHVLELGAGPGAATEELARLAGRVTSLEYDHAFAAKLGARMNGSNATAIQGDAATLPFADGTFSSAIAILMLRSEEHTSELQSLTNLVCRLLLEKKNKILE